MAVPERAADGSVTFIMAMARDISFFSNAEVKLDLHSAPNPVFASGDWNRLIQVVGNLLQSAAKFTSRSGLTNVTIQAESHRAVVKISDTGVGVAPEVLARLLGFAGVTLACHIEVEAWHARAMAYFSTP